MPSLKNAVKAEFIFIRTQLFKELFDLHAFWIRKQNTISVNLNLNKPCQTIIITAHFNKIKFTLFLDYKLSKSLNCANLKWKQCNKSFSYLTEKPTWERFHVEIKPNRNKQTVRKSACSEFNSSCFFIKTSVKDTMTQCKPCLRMFLSFHLSTSARENFRFRFFSWFETAWNKKESRRQYLQQKWWKKHFFLQTKFECPIFMSILWNVKNIYLVCFFSMPVHVKIEIFSANVDNFNILKTRSTDLHIFASFNYNWINMTYRSSLLASFRFKHLWPSSKWMLFLKINRIR